MEEPNLEQWLQSPKGQKNKSSWFKTSYFSHTPRAKFVVGMVGGLSQIIFGTAVIIVCMFQFIESLWLSITLLAAACVSVVIGLSVMSITLLRNSGNSSLIQRAINRVVKYKN